MDGELLRLIDSIHRDKSIDKDLIFESIEAGLHSAALKHLGASDDLQITIDRETGEIRAIDGEEEINPEELGRIAAQTTRQVIVQKIREAERDVLFEDYAERKNTIANGTVSRVEGSTIIVGMGRIEGILPKYEQIEGETYRVGDRIRSLVQDVKKQGSKVKVILSRSHPDFVRRLFEVEVPEIAEGVVEVKALAREAGNRTKICVTSLDAKIDCVGACVGVRGARIRNIVEELNGEKIDIIRWTEQPDVMIQNALRPAEIASIELNNNRSRAIVIVDDDQLSLAIGRRGQNVRLASKLTGWEIDIMSARQAEVRDEVAHRKLGTIPHITEEQVADLFDFGFRSFRDLANTDPVTLTQIESIDGEVALMVVTYAKENLDRERELDRKFTAEIETPPAPEGEGEGETAPAGETPPEASPESAAIEGAGAQFPPQEPPQADASTGERTTEAPEAPGVEVSPEESPEAVSAVTPPPSAPEAGEAASAPAPETSVSEPAEPAPGETSGEEEPSGAEEPEAQRSPTQDSG